MMLYQNIATFREENVPTIPMKVLIVEDEPKLAAFVKRGLEAEAFEAQVAYDGLIGQKMALNDSFDVIILDVNLPYVNGFDLVKKIRNEGINTPVLMLTALGELEDKVTGLDSGADDYLVKPFEFRELLARLRSLHRRSQAGPMTQHVLQVADLELDLEEKVARRGGKRIDLTAKEFSLLEYLMRNRGRVVSRVDIAEKVWDLHFDTGTNTIEVYINFLRKKVDKDFSQRLIHTVIGMGYVLREEGV